MGDTCSRVRIGASVRRARRLEQEVGWCGAAIKKRCVFAICTHNVRFEWELNALLKAAYTLSSSIAPACGLIIHVFHVGASSIIVKCVLLLAVVRLAVVISPLPLFAGLAGRRVGFV